MQVKKINGNEINKICTFCGLKYGINKNPKSIKIDPGFCDICELLGPKQIPQTLHPVESYDGIKGGIFDIEPKA